jgi:hypothetical protein
LIVTVLLAAGCGIFGEGRDADYDPVSESRLEKADGDSQYAANGGSVTVQVYLNPANPNSPFRGYPVRWEVVSGGGSVTSTSLTNSNGYAQVSWRLGPNATQQLRATTDIPGDDTSVTFTGFAHRLAIVSGAGQVIRTTAPLAPLVVALRDVDGTPLVGERIYWTPPSGISVPGSSFTDADGVAEVTPVIDDPDLLRNTFIAASVASRPGDRVEIPLVTAYHLVLVSGGNQTASPGSRLALPITVAWVDSVTGEIGPAGRFNWIVEQGGGTIDSSFVRWPGAPAPLSTGWILGPDTGVQVISLQRLFDLNALLRIEARAVNGASASGCGGNGQLHEGTGSYIPDSETWTAAASPHIIRDLVRFDVTATLTIQAGATICLESGAGIYLSRDLQAIGTPANPIRFLAADTSSGWNAVTLGGPAGTQMSQISNARFEHGFTAINAATPVRIDSTIIRQSRNIAIAIQNTSLANQIVHTTVDTTRSNSNPAVLINAPGTRFAGTVRGATSTVALMVNANDVTLDSCEISGNSSFGVLVGGFTGARVSGCNLTGNGNYAVAAGGGSVDARGNWWGSATVPSGTANGASAGVDATNPLAVPATLGYRPTW